jgi:hypothetical protein
MQPCRLESPCQRLPDILQQRLKFAMNVTLVEAKTEFPMKTYVASVGAKAVLAFRAEDDDEARAMVDDQEGSMRSDLKVLVDADGKPLWDGKSAIEAREATAAQHDEWKQSRDQAISDGEIDLNAGNNPDEWNVYLMSIHRTKKVQRGHRSSRSQSRHR